MPTTDWNWFFSSVAQSAAAIVGIFGAFIITKILASQSAFAEKSRRMQELITLGEKLRDASSRLPFDWYHRQQSSEALDKAERLLDEDDSLTPEALYEKVPFSPYIARETAVNHLEKVKSYREARIAREREEARQQAAAARAFGYSQAFVDATSRGLRSIDFPLRATLGPQIESARDELDAMYTEVRHHARLCSDFLGLVETNPESSRLVTASLLLILLLFFAGVIYPLSFMPVRTDWQPALALSEFINVLFSLQGAMLAGVSALFSALLAMFFVLNLRLRYPVVLIEKLASFTRLTSYSEFFANRAHNSAQRSAAGKAVPDGALTEQKGSG